MAGSAERSFMVRTSKYKYMLFPGSQRSEMFLELRPTRGR